MPTFTFQDIFKSSFLERLDAVSLPDAAIALLKRQQVPEQAAALRGLVGGFAAQKPLSVPLLAAKVQGVPDKTTIN